MTYSLLIVVIHLLAVGALLPFVPPPPDCKSSCTVALRNQTSDILGSAACTFIKDTYECELRSRALLNSSGTTTSSSSQICPLSKVRANLTPYSFDHPSYHTALSLNISLTILDQSTRAVAIRLACLQSGMEPEFYCENRTRPNWDQFYWPCRLFDFSSVSSSRELPIVFPLRFHNDCFRLTALSLYMVNVTLYPGNCVASYLFRMPSLTHVSAEVVTEWLPLVTIDANVDDGVWIHFSPAPASMRVRQVVVEVYEMLPEAELFYWESKSNSTMANIRKTLRRRGVVILPDTAIFFADLPRGSYWTIVYAQHDHCDDRKCISMQVPFNLTTDHYTSFTREEIESELRLKNAWVRVTAAVVGVIIAFVLIAASVVVYLRWKIARRKRRPSAVNFVRFTRRPIVLILYTNDFAQHRRCVLELATYLKTRANCEIEVDEWAMSSASNGYRSPTEWLAQALQRADYYLMVFSSGTKETVFRRGDSSYAELRPERPWDETFASAITFVLQRILQVARSTDATSVSTDNIAAFRRFICVSFSYSPSDSMPDLFMTFPCPKFSLPSDLHQLICHVHEFPCSTIYEGAASDSDRLNTSVSDASKFMETNPNWLQDRLVEVERPMEGKSNERQTISEISSTIGRLRLPVVQQLPENLDEFYADLLNPGNGQALRASPGEQNEEQFRLLPPPGAEENAASANGNQYELLPPDDDELAIMFYSNVDSSRSHAHA